MEQRFQTQIKRLQAYNFVLSLAVLGLFMVAFRPMNKTRFEEIDVERLNIVQPDGKPVAVLSNKEHFPLAVVNGRVLDPVREAQGLVFYNEAGEECGGYLFSGGENGEQLVHFTMDQYQQDQALTMKSRSSRDELGAFNMVGLTISGRPTNRTLDQQDALADSIALIADPAERSKAFKWLQDSAEGVNNTLFMGKTEDDDYGLFLTDRNGKDRLIIYVDKAGNPKLELLDAWGKPVLTLPEK